MYEGVRARDRSAVQPTRMHRSVLQDAEFRSSRCRRQAALGKEDDCGHHPDGDDAEQHRETDGVRDRLRDTSPNPGNARGQDRTSASTLHSVVNPNVPGYDVRQPDGSTKCTPNDAGALRPLRIWTSGFSPVLPNFKRRHRGARYPRDRSAATSRDRREPRLHSHEQLRSHNSGEGLAARHSRCPPCMT